MSWLASLIDAPPQARKTAKAFQVMADRLRTAQRDVLGLFVTQANSTMSALQIVNRMSRFDDLLEIFPKDNIIRTADFDPESEGNLMMVDFWNVRNTEKMLRVANDYEWKHVMIVVDECEQGGQSGVYNRLKFIHEVEKACKPAQVNVVFITATIANLSDAVYRFRNLASFKGTFIEKIVTEACIEKHHAVPHPSYVGASWYKNTEDAWKELRISAKEPGEKRDDYETKVFKTVCKSLKELPDDNKQLAFVVAGTLRDMHKKLANRMFRLGFNVTIELNCTNTKNYTVMYDNDCGETKEWKIPYSAIEKLAAAGEMKKYTSFEDGVDYDSGIDAIEDLTLSHVLQAGLRLGTDMHRDILKNIADDERVKLLTIFTRMKTLTGESRRPDDYPKKPKIAMIAGNLASRGNTIQNPFIGFTFTSSLYYNGGKSTQRGALNAQAVGRSNGTLLESYTSSTGVKPILISTKTIMRDAIANEEIVKKKAAEIPNGQLIMLRDLVTKEEWDDVLDEANKKFKGADSPKNVYKRILELINASKNGKYNFSTKSLNENEKDLIAIVNANKREILSRMANMGLVTNVSKGSGIWEITASGKDYLLNN